MATKIINVLKDDKIEDIIEIFKKAPSQEVIFVLPKRHKALSKEGDFIVLSALAEEHGKKILFLSSNPEVNKMALEYKFGILADDKHESKSRSPKTKTVFSKPVEIPETDSPGPVVKSEELIPNAGDSLNSVAESAVSFGDVDDVASDDDRDVGTSDESVGSGDGYEEEEKDDVSDNNKDPWNDESGASVSYRKEDPHFPDVELTVLKQPSKMVSDILEPGKEGERVKIGISKKPEKPLEVNVRRDPVKTDIDEIESVWQRRPNVAKPEHRIKEDKISALPRSSFVLPRFSLLNFSRTSLTILGAGVVVIFGIVLYVTTGSAQVVIKLRAVPLDFNFKVTASDKILDVDTEAKKIPGQLFYNEKSVEESFLATGEKDVVQKARGKITVYNEYSPTTQVLIATTRFESEGGFVFRTLQTISVPGTKIQNGNVVPGSVEVDVIADKAGDTYNINSGKFIVSAFKEKGDSERLAKIYGKSESAMKGGIVGKAKVVTEKDYNDAVKKIEGRVVSETEAELKTQASGLKILSLSQPVIKEIKSSAQIDEAADSFTVSAKAELGTVGFKESDLHAVISSYVGKINDLTVLPEKLSIEFKDVKFNQEEKSLVFAVFVKGPAYHRIDQEKVMKELIGKNEKEIKEFISGIQDVVFSAKVVLTPFWVKRVPANREKLKFELQYE